MQIPDSLPEIIEYRMASGVTLHALPRRPVETVSSSGKHTAAMVKATIPIGANAWRLVTDVEWRPLSELPKDWMPFLQRKRGTSIDPRSKNEPRGQHKAKDAIIDSD